MVAPGERSEPGEEESERTKPLSKTDLTLKGSNKPKQAMSTYTQIIYHIVFSTKNRQRTLDLENHEPLFRYVWGIIKNKQSVLHQINGFTDHLHILTSLHPAVALADFVKDIKLACGYWIRKEGRFPAFDGWQDGYGAFTHSFGEKPRLIDYIRAQKEHHRELTFIEEYKQLLRKAGIEFDEKYLA